MTESSPHPDVQDMNFEEALTALERIVASLEQGDASLEDSIGIYERGEALKLHCTKLLKAAEDRIEKIRLSCEGEPIGVDAFDDEKA